MARRSAQKKQNVRFSSVGDSPTLPFPPLFLRFATWAAISLDSITPSTRPRRVGPIRPPATRPPVAQSCCSSFVPIVTGTSDWYGGQFFEEQLTIEVALLVSLSTTEYQRRWLQFLSATTRPGGCKHSWSLEYALDWLLDKMISHCR
jgi:hypothetical protein